MESKFSFFKSRTKLARLVGITVAVLLFTLEIIICVQFVLTSFNPWLLAVLVVCEVALDVLCVVELLAVRGLKARVVIYIFDFFLLFVICALTGSLYLSALYCVILSQLYVNVDEFKSKLAVFVTSCVLFVLTGVVGWLLQNISSVTYAQIFDIVSDCLLNLIILLAHFAVANFLISFYRTNQKLTEALKQADESQKQLEEAYKQLSEKAVFEERNRIARDIHDNAGHSMTSVIMQTEAAKLIIDSNPQEAKAKIISANIQAKNALEQMRESVHLLAGRGDTSTLKEELEEIIAQTCDGTGVTVRCDLQDISISYEKRRFIANTLKECFANGMRHGGATAFYVELTAANGEVKLVVSDNGSGLAPDFKEGFGLRGIREKSRSFGGGVIYESEYGEGTEITVTVEGKND